MDKLATFGAKLGSQRHLQSISSGLMTIMPITVFGSIFQIISSLPEIFPFLPSYSEELNNMILFPYTLTFALLGIIAVYSISFFHARSYNLNLLQTPIISTIAFILIVASFDGEQLDMTYIGSNGMFVAIVVALISVEIIHFLQKNNIKLKLPESIPPVAAAAFDAIIPMTTVIVIFYIVSIICQILTGEMIPTVIMNLLSPAIEGSESLWFCMLVAFLINLFGFFGIHGFNVLAGIILPLLISNTAENATAFAAGETATKIFTLPMFQMSGIFYWLIPIMFIRSKSQKLKAVGKISLIPSIFNVSEPIQFGAPIMLNPILGIPWVLYSTVNMGIVWCFMYFGFVNKAVVAAANSIPMPLFQYLATLDWRVFILFTIMLCATYIIWKPFIMIYDKKCLEEETNGANE